MAKIEEVLVYLKMNGVSVGESLKGVSDKIKPYAQNLLKKKIYVLNHTNHSKKKEKLKKQIKSLEEFVNN